MSLFYTTVYFLFVFFNSANKAQQGHLQLTLENHIFVVKEMLFNGKDFIDGFIWHLGPNVEEKRCYMTYM